MLRSKGSSWQGDVQKRICLGKYPEKTYLSCEKRTYLSLEESGIDKSKLY